MKKIILLALLSSSLASFSQNGFADWDKNYPYKNAEIIVKEEKAYAKKVETDKDEAPYYVSLQKFRFIAEFTGNIRPIQREVSGSMYRVFKIKMGNNQILDDLLSHELEFNIGSTTLWMPIQTQLINDFKSEIAPKSKVLLYTLLCNEHDTKNNLYNSFLISEFTSEWK